DARGSIEAMDGAGRRALQALGRIAIAATQVASCHAQEQMPASGKQSLPLERGEDLRNVAGRHAERRGLARRVRRGHEAESGPRRTCLGATYALRGVVFWRRLRILGGSSHASKSCPFSARSIAR